MIDMHHIIANLELLDFLQREGDLTTTCLVALQTVLMITVEQLMIGKVALLAFMVREALVNRYRNRIEHHKGAPLTVCIENLLQTTYLLVIIGKDIEGVTIAQQLLESVRHQFEILVEQRLDSRIKRHLYIFIQLFRSYSPLAAYDYPTTTHDVTLELLLGREKIRPSPFIPSLQGRGVVTFHIPLFTLHAPLFTFNHRLP